MPKLSSISLHVLDDLASQLRYAPASRALAQVRAAMTLAAELEPDRVYPEDWLVHRVTGYRPDIAEPAMLVGAAILRDLSAFAERVSDRASLAPGAIGEELSLAELCARWSVSARTIERYRREGLVAVRVRENGRSRLVFSRDAVEGYEGAHRSALARAGARSRLGADRRARIVRVAQRAQRRFGWSLNEAAKQIAAREGRSHEAVRQTLLKAGGSRSAIGSADRRRRVALRAARMGVPIEMISERFGKSPQTIRRILAEEWIAVLRETLPGVAAGRVGHADAGALEPPAAGACDRPVIEAVSGDWVTVARATAPPERAEEADRARAVRVLIARAWAEVVEMERARRRRGAPPCEPGVSSAEALDRAQTDLRWATLLATLLVASQRGFILKTVEARLDRSVLDLPTRAVRSLHRAVMDAAVTAVWRYDPGKGGRLAGVTGLAVDRAVAEWMRTNGAALPEPGGRAHNAGASLEDWSLRLGAWQPWLGPDPRLLRVYESLDAEARGVVEARFGLAGSPPMTRAEIGRALGMSARRVERGLRDALARARRAAPDAG